MKKNRYGGQITWAGTSDLILPKQPATRRLVYLAALGTFMGESTSIGMTLNVEDGGIAASRLYVCAAALTNNVTFDTMFFFAEDVGNETTLAYDSYAQATCSLGKDCYIDASSKLTLSAVVAPDIGNVTVTFVFEDVE
jgi:hypothetical protein